MRWLIIALALTAAACGSSPTSPAPVPIVTVSGLTLQSSSDMMKIGTSETFTVTATRSDGSTGAVTGATWGSDNAAVASVDGNGAVQPRAAGLATIIVDYQGRRATKLIRVVPDVQGHWVGTWTKVSCTESGGFAGSCDSLSTGGLDITLNQTRDTVSGQIFIGSAPVTVTGSLDQGGAMTLTGQGTVSAFQTNVGGWSTTSTPTTMSGGFTFVVSSAAAVGATTVKAVLSGVVKR